MTCGNLCRAFAGRHPKQLIAGTAATSTRVEQYLKGILASRYHHLIKTFWGWRDQQLPDGTLIWTSPSGHTYVTTPGSALLFPGLCAPTGTLTPPNPAHNRLRCIDRGVMMPKRRRTRAQNRAHHIATQRRQNQRDRQHQQHREEMRIIANDEPPPF
jgi:hypothetical protein